MDREEYAKFVIDTYMKPHSEDTPDDQRFPIGTVVRIVNPQSWFAKRYNKTDLFEVQYTYMQKYWGNDCKSYSLKNLVTGEESSWFQEEELEEV